MQKLSLITAGLVAFSLAASAQKINTDSLSIVSKISEYQFKMAKLQNTVQQTTWNKQDAAVKVQNASDKSSQDANRLDNDPQNKQLAKASDNAASDARIDSKKARKANRKLDDLNKEISELNGKITDEQTRLSVYTGVATPVTTPAVMPVVADTTHHS
jgi:chromosome segregation ATPase